MGNEIVNEVAAEDEELIEETRDAIEEWRDIMHTLLVLAARNTSPAVRKMALAAWSSGKADEQLIRSLALEKLVRIAYVAEDPEIRASARKGLVDRGLAAPRDFERRSCDELLATLAGMGLPAVGLVG